MNSSIKVVKPSGILDGDSSKVLRQEIEAFLSAGVETILIDFQDVSFLNSSGLGVLVAILKKVHGQGAQLFICSLTEQVKMIFTLTKMETIFKIFESREAFEAEFAQN